MIGDHSQPARRVFISGTSELWTSPAGRTWVDAARAAIELAGDGVVEMTRFGAHDDPPWEVCAEKLRTAQVYVGVFGFRYGSLLPDACVSYTEREFQYATELRLPRLVFLMDDPTAAQRSKDEHDAERQWRFRALVQSDGAGRPLTPMKVSSPGRFESSLVYALCSLPQAAAPPKMLNEPPRVIPLTIRDRVPERQALRERLLAGDARVVALVGEPGSGKSAVVRELVWDLHRERSGDRFEVLSYISATSHRLVTAATLLTEVASAVPQDVIRGRLLRELQQREASWYDRVEDVLRELRQTLLVVIDQVETVLDDEARFIDRGLERLLTELSARDDHRVTVLLVTSRVPAGGVLDPAAGALLELDGNLSDEFGAAEQLLQDLAERVRPPALASAWGAAITVAGRHPRTLELVVAAFALDPLLTVEGLQGLRDLEGEVRRTLVDHIERHLTGEQLAVVRVLAVVGLPCEGTQVAELLELVVRGADVREALAFLARVRLIREVDCAYSLPVADAQDLLDRWSRDAAGKRSLALMKRLAAEHLAARVARRSVRGLQDVAERFREIALRLDLRDHATCITLMDSLERDYLTGWGERHVLMPWRRRLLSELPYGEHAWRHTLSAMVAGANELDDGHEAMALLRDLQMWRSDDRSGLSAERRAWADEDELAVLTQLGYTLFRDGRCRSASNCFSEELQGAQRLGQVYEQGRAHLGLSLCLLDQGAVSEAQEHLDKASALPPPLDRVNRLTLHAEVLLAQANVARVRGDEAAPAWAERAIAAARDAGSTRLRIRAIDLLAAVLLERRHDDPAAVDLERVLDLAREAADLAAINGITDLSRIAHATLAVAQLARGGQGLNAASSAATSAARFLRTKRGVEGILTLGIVELRAKSRGWRDRVKLAFHDAARSCEQFDEADGRPYWVWDALGLARTGLHLCRVPTADTRAIEAYRMARTACNAQGAVRRATLLFDTLALDVDDDGLVAVRNAALGVSLEDPVAVAVDAVAAALPAHPPTDV